MVGAGLAIALAVGAAAMLSNTADPPPGQGPALDATGPIAFDSSQPLESRIAALEQALHDERQARQLLQDEVFFLTETVERFSASGRSTQRSDAESVSAAAVASDSRRRGRGGRDSRDDNAARVDRFVAAGFSEGEAAYILQRESELRMDALRARYDAQRAGEETNFFGSRTATADALREELGDADYERYREATGLPTEVFVSSVLDGSPALSAGLQPGDRIVSYDGRRVFSMREITTLTMQGEVGDTVLVNVERQGTLIQVAMPRGPLGITGGRRTR